MVCKVEGCGRSRHARGLCRRHYEREPDVRAKRNERWKQKYRSNPEFNARVKATAKRSYFRRDHAYDLVCAWKSRNRAKVSAYQRRYRTRLKEARGVGHSAKFYPGRECHVFANKSWQRSEIVSRAFRRGPWHVTVRLPWGECVDFKTSDVRLGLFTEAV